MTAHSPGPWAKRIWRHPGKADTVCIVDAQDREIVAWPGFDGLDLTKAEIRANARLIAAAPELLAALNIARGWLEGWASAEHQLELIDAAIEKATGL